MSITNASSITSAALDLATRSPVLTAAFTISTYSLYRAIDFMVIDPWRSPLNALPGPPKPGMFFDLAHMHGAMGRVVSTFGIVGRLLPANAL